MTATSPTSSLPGVTTRSVSSSSTRTRSFTAKRAGAISLPAVASLRVIIPSEAPSESMSVTSGRWRSSPAFDSGLQVTPDDVIARSAERSHRSAGPAALPSGTAGDGACGVDPDWCASSSASSGRANASPTMVSTATSLRSTSSQMRAGSRPGSSRRTTVPAPASVESVMKRPVPCISGQAGRHVPARLPSRAAATGSGGSVPGRAICHSAT